MEADLYKKEVCSRTGRGGKCKSGRKELERVFFVRSPDFPKKVQHRTYIFLKLINKRQNMSY